MDLNCREFLRLLTIAAHSEKGYDRGGGRLRDMNSNWNGAILPEVEREFEKTTEWQRYQDALLESAEAQIAKETKLINNPQREQILSNPGNAPSTLSSKCGVDAAGAEPEDHSAESPDLWSAVCALQLRAGVGLGSRMAASKTSGGGGPRRGPPPHERRVVRGPVSARP